MLSAQNPRISGSAPRCFARFRRRASYPNSSRPMLALEQVCWFIVLGMEATTGGSFAQLTPQVFDGTALSTVVPDTFIPTDERHSFCIR